MINPDNSRGILYISLGWVLTLIIYVIVAIRIYSRSILVRSLGSDDFTLLVSVVLTTMGSSGDTLAVSNGLGEHESTLAAVNIAQVQKWLQIDWIIVFISFGFLRASVMLFVLRLLPVYKRWQKRVLVVAFCANIAAVLIGVVSYGLSCIPFRAWYEPVPDAKCFSKHDLVITYQVNGALFCAIDITTAIVPQFLLWDVQMKKTTKRGLNVIFALGLITSGLSIARIATISDRVEDSDTTYRAIPTTICSLVEEKMGIIVACGPAIRQFVAYIKRIGSVLPSKERQKPQEDFVKMRRRITVRDILWFRSPSLVSGRVVDAQPIMQSKISEDVESTAQKSFLNEWPRKLGNKLFRSNASKSRTASNATSEISLSRDIMQNGNETALPDQEKGTGRRH